MCLAAVAVSLLIALLLLPGIAGLLEGDFEYPRWRIQQGWNSQNDVNYAQALADIYAWSFWRIGVRSEAPVAYQFYEIVREILNTGSRR